MQGDRAAPAKALKLLGQMRAAGVVPNAHAFGAAVTFNVDRFVPQPHHVDLTIAGKGAAGIVPNAHAFGSAVTSTVD